MRISDVKTYVLGTAWRNLTYVEVHTDDGLVGVGEVRMLNHTDASRRTPTVGTQSSARLRTSTRPRNASAQDTVVE
jgi:L-alanine-DL-glutamate epimerase-like enolase superfamily enzyme